MTGERITRMFKEYQDVMNRQKIYIVARDNIGRVLDLEENKSEKIVIKKGVQLRRIKKVKRDPDILELKKKDFPNLRFYVLRKNLKLINQGHVREYMEKWKLERRRRRNHNENKSD